MSGGAFDYAQYRIDDIVSRIEREVERATCERPPLVTRSGVAVYEVYEQGSRRYCSEYRFVCFESAVEYFNNNDRYRLLRGASRDGEKIVIYDDVYTGEVYEVKQYTYEEYEADEDGEIPYFPDYSEETIREFRKGISILKKAGVYAQRIDWLISGDDGEESFHKRLTEDLKKLETLTD